MLKIVEVIDIPVRYKNVRYRAGESFEMEEEHVNKNLVKVIGDAAPKAIEEMTIQELKSFAAEHEIDLGEAKKKDDILAAIQEALKDNEEPPEE